MAAAAAYDPADHVADAFRSARLHYRRADAGDARFRALVARLENDPVVQAHAAPTALQPKGPRQLDDYAAAVGRALLGVVVCLGGSGDDDDDEQQQQQPPPTMIGIVALGWGGIDAAVAHHRTAHLAVSLAAPYRGRGFGREAINWMLDWAFRHGALHTVAVTAAAYNGAACRLYESIGFVREGRRRETIWMDRAWHDEVEFGMTEREWERLRARQGAEDAASA